MKIKRSQLRSMIMRQLLKEQNNRADKPTDEDIAKLTSGGNRRTMRRQVRRGTSAEVLWALYDDMVAVEKSPTPAAEDEEDAPATSDTAPAAEEAEEEETVEKGEFEFPGSGDPYTYTFDQAAKTKTRETEELHATAVTKDGKKFGPRTFKVPRGHELYALMAEKTDAVKEFFAKMGKDAESVAGPAEPVDVDDIAPIIDKLASIAYMDSSYKESINTPDDDQKKEWHRFAVNHIERPVSPDHARQRVKGDMSSQLTPAAHEEWSQLADELMDVIGDRLPVDMGDFDYSRTFNVEGAPDTQAESFSRANLRSMILREILARR